jgi:hypothetical protein
MKNQILNSANVINIHQKKLILMKMMKNKMRVYMQISLGNKKTI